MAGHVPVSDGIFVETADGIRLLGSRCLSCGNHLFPVQSGCPRCTAEETETVELDHRGTLWTWTVQSFPPKAPPYLGPTDAATFQPFGVGYVELADQVRVEARLTEADPANLRIGMAMELVTVPLATDGDCNEIVTFGFRPIGDATAGGAR